jgi:hypothetical protein
VQNYAYAADTVQGDSGVVGWTSTTDSSMTEHLLAPEAGATYYTSLRVRNNADLMAGDTTSDGTIYLRPSALDEEDPLGSLTLYPSPLEEGERLELRVLSERPLDLRTTLYDSRGRLIQKKELDLSSGRTVHSFEPDLSAGVHHLRISGEAIEDRVLRFLVR